MYRRRVSRVDVAIAAVLGMCVSYYLWEPILRDRMQKRAQLNQQQPKP